MRQAALSSNEALRARPMRPDWSRGRTISPSARGDTTVLHGPLQRLLDGRILLPLRKDTPPEFRWRVDIPVVPVLLALGIKSVPSHLDDPRRVLLDHHELWMQGADFVRAMRVN